MASPVSSSSAAMVGSLQHAALSSPSSSLFGGSGSSSPLKKTGVASNATPSISHTSSNRCYNGRVMVPGRNLVVCATKSDDEAKQTTKDRWAGLAYDISDDQQDITRGKGMVDSVFQGAVGMGTQHAVMSSYDYISQGQRFLNMDNMKDGYYIAPAFMDKLVVHIAKNFMSLPNIKVPLILGIWGGKGQGKSYQCELVFSKLGINPITMSAGELESGNAGEPAKLIRQRYREAADIIRKKGKMCCLFINDLDAGAGRMGGTTQYTVNNQMVNATLMNIADNPTNVQLPGVYNKEEIPRVPVIVTGNDFSTLYAPLIRDGRMEKFYWAPTREDRIGVCSGIFRVDDVNEKEIAKLVDAFPGQSIDFFGAIRARVYDDEVRKWVVEVGVEGMGKLLVNSKTGPPTFKKPSMTLDKLLEYGQMLVQEQDNVKRVKLADKYLKEAALGDANDDSIKQGTFYGAKQASIQQKGSSNESKEDVVGKVEEEEIKEEITSVTNEKEEEEKPIIANENIEEEETKEEEKKPEEEEKPIIANEKLEEEETKEEETKLEEEEPITESPNVIESTVNVVDDVKIESIATTEEVVEDDNKTSVNVVNTQVKVVEEESVAITAESVDTIEPVVNVVEEIQTIESVNVVETIAKDENLTTITESIETVKVVVNTVEKENESTTTTKAGNKVEPLVKDEKMAQKANAAEKKTNEEAGRELSRQSVTGALRGLLSTVLSILKR